MKYRLARIEISTAKCVAALVVLVCLAGCTSTTRTKSVKRARRDSGAAHSLSSGGGVKIDHDDFRGMIEMFGRAKVAYMFGCMAMNSSKPFVPNYDAAHELLAYAVDLGHVGAKTQLGFLYEQGFGVKRNLRKAIECYKFAAKHNDLTALHNLAQCYMNGVGVRKNPQKAAELHTIAAELGSAPSQLILGAMYTRGNGVPRDDVLAYKWLNLAAIHGNRNAVFLRDATAQDMSRSQIAEAQRLSRSFRPKTGRSGACPGDQENVPKGGGTGFFVSTNGLLLTAYHVIQGAERIIVRVNDKELLAKTVHLDPVDDLALLKVDGMYEPLHIRSTHQVEIGSKAFTMGYPNVSLQGRNPKFTAGTVSSLSGAQDDPRHFQISVQVQPGNSGGPLLDENSNVIGLVVSRLDDLFTLLKTGSIPQNVNYALKSSFICASLEHVAESVCAESNAGVDSAEGSEGGQQVARKVKASIVQIITY